MENEKEVKANEIYAKNFSDSQRKVLDKIAKQHLNKAKLLLLDNPKMKFDNFLTVVFFTTLADINKTPSKFKIVPQGEASWIGVKNEDIFNALVKLGFPVKLI